MAAEVNTMFEECKQKLEEHPETQPLCPPDLCLEQMREGHWHEFCLDKSPYTPIQTIGCFNAATAQWVWGPIRQIKQLCMEKAKQDPNWELEQCFCCCVGPPGWAAIGLPEDTKRPIGEIGVGDTMLAGKIEGGRVEWEPATVGFSQGTESEDQTEMVRVAYGDGAGLTVPPDQPLMLADGKLTTAGDLAPGQELMGVDGDPVPVGDVKRGSYEGSVHHIATDPDWNGSLDGHLIQVNGVVAGDFTLQLHFAQVPDSQKSEGS